MAKDRASTGMKAGVRIENLCIKAGGKPVLTGLDLTLPARGLIAVMGPMGGGKSTLLRFLSGALPAGEFATSWARADYRGQPLSANHHGRLVAQADRAAQGTLAERMAALDALTRGNTDLLCIDEPTAGLEPEAGAKLMQRLEALAETRAVLMVSHNVREVRNHCHHVALIGGGRVVCALPAPQFFDMKTDPHAIHYICTGGLDIPDVKTPIRQLAPENRITPEGFDTTPATGDESWIIQDSLSLQNLPPGSFPPCILFRFGRERLDIHGPEGNPLRSLSWQGEEEKPDRNPPLTAEMCAALKAHLDTGARVVIDTHFNQTAVSALLGAFLIMHGFAPAEALKITAAKLPMLHLGMRLEEFLWNIDLHLATSGG